MMKGTLYYEEVKVSEAKIVTILKEAEAGMTVAEISRKYGVLNRASRSRTVLLSVLTVVIVRMCLICIRSGI